MPNQLEFAKDMAMGLLSTSGLLLTLLVGFQSFSKSLGKDLMIPAATLGICIGLSAVTLGEVMDQSAKPEIYPTLEDRTRHILQLAMFFFAIGVAGLLVSMYLSFL